MLKVCKLESKQPEQETHNAQVIMLNNEIENIWNIEGIDRQVICALYYELESDSRSTVSAWLVVSDGKDKLVSSNGREFQSHGCNERKVSFSVTFGYSVKEFKVRQ